MNAELHRSETRGRADHGWLSSFHSFSFANYYNPERMGFGLLRVINDDIIAPSAGFGTHPHQNMEIISIPISGALRHEDTMGNKTVIKDNEVQAMSAGSGIAHSEYNNSDKEDANFLQIWVMPKKMNITPSYSQKQFDPLLRKNKWQLIVSPDGQDNSVAINQDAFFSRIDLTEKTEISYTKRREENGIYLFVLSGEIKIGDEVLKTKDALGNADISELSLKANHESQVLLIDVPMK